jgi:uncharacterized membrane protein
VADLVTHLATALIPGVGLRADRAVLLALGSALPDLGGRVPGLVAEALDLAGFAVPEAIYAPFGVLHQPLGASLLAVALAFVLDPRDRAVGAGLLVLGVALHLGLDVFQFHHGYGYFLLAPLSFQRFELGWMGAEATVPLAPWLALATAGVWAVRGVLAWRRRRG